VREGVRGRYFYDHAILGVCVECGDKWDQLGHVVEHVMAHDNIRAWGLSLHGQPGAKYFDVGDTSFVCGKGELVEHRLLFIDARNVAGRGNQSDRRATTPAANIEN
jgi:hypothetical protein